MSEKGFKKYACDFYRDIKKIEDDYDRIKSERIFDAIKEIKELELNRKKNQLKVFKIDEMIKETRSDKKLCIYAGTTIAVITILLFVGVCVLPFFTDINTPDVFNYLIALSLPAIIFLFTESRSCHYKIRELEKERLEYLDIDI